MNNNKDNDTQKPAERPIEKPQEQAAPIIKIKQDEDFIKKGSK